MKKTGEGRLLKKDLSNYSDKEYKNPSVTVDVAICTLKDGALQILLIKRKYHPFKGWWAFPGGFVSVEAEETLEATAQREIEEETGVKLRFDRIANQLRTYGDPHRDPRKRVITVAYYTLIPYEEITKQTVKAGDDAKEAKWFPIKKLPSMAFDHKNIVYDLEYTLRTKAWNSSLVFQILPKQFTWSELQKTFEIFTGFKDSPYNFQRKILSKFNLKISPADRAGTMGRPAKKLSYPWEPPICF